MEHLVKEAPWEKGKEHSPRYIFQILRITITKWNFNSSDILSNLYQ